MIFQPSILEIFREINPLSLENDFRLLDNNFRLFSAALSITGRIPGSFQKN
jgi:hypothetical protein